jgi:primary-amine oxidase
LAASLEQRTHFLRAPCTVRDALNIEAPKENIWGELSGPETATIVAWLFAQKELNLTTVENAGSWDNTL